MDNADPMIDEFKRLEELDLAELRYFDGVGAEKFAEHAFNFADKLIREKTNNRCYVVKVECAEHGAHRQFVPKNRAIPNANWIPMSQAWRQEKPEYVNKLHNMVRRNCTLPFRFGCYTENPKGLDPQIEVFPT